MGPNYTEKLCFSAKKTIKQNHKNHKTKTIKQTAKKTIKQKDNIQAGEKYLQMMLPTRG